MAQSMGGSGRVSSGGSARRARAALTHQQPDRTPLFEHYWPYQPIYWDVVGRTPATDEAMHFDALADGIGWEELLEMEAQALYQVNKFFQVDVIHSTASGGPGSMKVKKLGDKRWEAWGRTYHWNPQTARVELENPTEADADSNQMDEEKLRERVAAWDGSTRPVGPERFKRFARIKQLAERDGIDWLYMAEEGGGTGAAAFRPFQYFWMAEEPELFARWRDMHAMQGLVNTRAAIEAGADLVALGGDVSCDKGPLISPDMYRRFILPAIQRQVDLIHSMGALAVYTSDGNHWPIKEDYFFNSRIDGCKECDHAAGMNMKRLAEEGVKDRVTIFGNVDARHILCRGTPQQTRQHVFEVLKWGSKTPGGHFLATSHSVHEGVRLENYYAMIDAYREYFGMEELPEPPHGRGGFPPA